MPPLIDLAPGARQALVVGTGTYTDPGLRRLRAPARDAADLADVLADPAIGDFAVTSVIDQSAQKIRLALEDFLEDRSTGDMLLVYLSCHGLLDVRRHLYFAATDTRKDRLASTGVAAAWVLDQLEHCRARRQVLILDSCYSGAFANGAKGDSDTDLDHRFFMGQGRGRVVLTASTANEYSFEGEPTDESAARSRFTAALVQGLRTGAADTDRDGYVSVDDAYAYVFDQVQAAGAGQTPQRCLYEGQGSIILARNPVPPGTIPAPLPESLRFGLDSPYPEIRVGAVTTLGRWLTSGNSAREATARQQLQEVVDTDNPRVAGAARALLHHPEDAEHKRVENPLARLTGVQVRHESQLAAGTSQSSGHVNHDSGVTPAESSNVPATTATLDSGAESRPATRGETLASIELFTGCGGLALAMHEAGFRHLLTLDWDKRAGSTLLMNVAEPYSGDTADPASSDGRWPLVNDDVRNVDFSPWHGAVDVVAGGVAFQPRNLYDLGNGMANSRNLWPELLRCVRETQPLAVIAECPRGLLRPSFSPYRDYIMRNLSAPFESQAAHEDWIDCDQRLQKALSRPPSDPVELYDVTFRLVNAADYGVPQVTRRVFVVAFRSDLGLGDWTFPEPTHSEDALRLDQNSGEYWARHGLPNPGPARQTITDFVPSRPWVTLRDAISGLPEPVDRIEAADWLHHYGWPGAREYPGHLANELDRPSRAIKAGARGLPGGEGVVRLDDGSIRNLTVREVARVMTFPDAWWLAGPRGEQIRQLGNAVPVILGRRVADSVASALRSVAPDRHAASAP